MLPRTKYGLEMQVSASPSTAFPETEHSDAEFPLLEALRTKPGVPRPAAFDPKPKSASKL